MSVKMGHHLQILNYLFFCHDFITYLGVSKPQICPAKEHTPFIPIYLLLQYETCLFLVDGSAEGEVGGVWNDPGEFGGDGNVARLIGRGLVSFNGWL